MERARDRQSFHDQRFMREALALGWRQQGLTSPNPSVGVVIVGHEGDVPVILGRGATQSGGRPHGEPVALARAGEAARGATLYVTLEPCAHHGRAGPCCDAVIAAGVARVVSAKEDPDPRVAGQGHARMRAVGIQVDVGILAEEAARAHLGHVLRVTQGRPAITLKVARTADGFVASRSHERLLITGQAANQRIHLLRAHEDAILVGLNTVLADDPMLTVRLPGMDNRSPIRVILDSKLQTPLMSRLVTGAREHPTWIITTDTAPSAAEDALRHAGVDIIRVENTLDGRVSLPAALHALAQRGIARILAEGGPRLADALVESGLVDNIVLVTARGVRLSGAGATADLGRTAGPELMAAVSDPARFRLWRRDIWGDDVCEEFERID